MISEDVQNRIRVAAQNRCGYCLSHQQYVLGKHEIEHIVPTAKGGTNDGDNLWLACRLCNGYKGIKMMAHDSVTGQIVSLFNPRKQRWKRHFQWSEDGTRIIGKTRIGRATVIALQLNDPIAVEVRRNWVAVSWHPPKEAL